MTTYTFSPWTLVNGRRVVAPESQWSAVERLERDYVCGVQDTGYYEDEPDPPVVRIGVDLFEPFEGEYSDSVGGMVFVDGDSSTVGPGTTFTAIRPATTADILDRLFDLIDRCPHLRFIAETEHPENVPAMLPLADEGGRYPFNDPRLRKIIEAKGWLAEYQRRDNLTITAPDGRNVEDAK